MNHNLLKKKKKKKKRKPRLTGDVPGTASKGASLPILPPQHRLR